MKNLCFLFQLKEPSHFLVSVFVYKFSHGQVICGLRLGLRVSHCGPFSPFMTLISYETSHKSSEFSVSATPPVKREQWCSIILRSTSKSMGVVGLLHGTNCLSNYLWSLWMHRSSISLMYCFWNKWGLFLKCVLLTSVTYYVCPGLSWLDVIHTHFVENEILTVFADSYICTCI